MGVSDNKQVKNQSSKSTRLIVFGVLAISLFGSAPFSLAGTATVPEKNLTEQLREKAEASVGKTPTEKKRIMEDAINQVRVSGIVEKAKKQGDLLPAFELSDAKLKTVKSTELLARGPLVVVFYRGGWCPYCNLQLRDLQKHLGEIKKLGAELVAISPQVPDATLSTTEKDALSFHVLSDTGNKVARSFGLVYSLPKDLQGVYKEFGIDLEKSNGNKDWELPLGATYVVGKDGCIVYSFLDADYKKRAETADLLAALQRLVKASAPGH